MQRPVFNKPQAPMTADQYIQMQEELARRNAGGFTAVGQDVPTNMPYAPSSGYRPTRNMVDIGSGWSYAQNPNRPVGNVQFDDRLQEFVDPTTGETYGVEDIHMDSMKNIDPNITAPFGNQPQPEQNFQFGNFPDVNNSDASLMDDMQDDPIVKQYSQPEQQVPQNRQVPFQQPQPQQQMPGSVFGASTQSRPQPQRQQPVQSVATTPSLRQNVGNVFAKVGKKLNLPEFGLSESIAGVAQKPLPGVNAQMGSIPRSNIGAVGSYAPMRGVPAPNPAGDRPAGMTFQDRSKQWDSVINQGDNILGASDEFDAEYQEADRQSNEAERKLLEMINQGRMGTGKEPITSIDQINQEYDFTPSTQSGDGISPTPTQQKPVRQSTNVFGNLIPFGVQAAERGDEITPNEPMGMSFSIPRAGEGIKKIQDEIQPRVDSAINKFRSLKDQPFKRIGETSANIAEGVDSIKSTIGNKIGDVAQKGTDVVKGGVLSAVNNVKNVIGGGTTTTTKAQPAPTQNNNQSKPTPVPTPTQNNSNNNNQSKAQPAPVQNNNQSKASPAPAPAPKVTPAPTPAPKPTPAPPKPTPAPAPPKPAPKPAPAPAPKTNVFTNFVNWLFRR